MSQPKEILLHVGHGKTGTSFLQSVLAASSDALHFRQVCYPISNTDRERAAKGLTTSGNLSNGENSWDKMLMQADDIAGMSLLVSNENLFQRLFDTIAEDISTRHPGVPVSVLLFVRNPLENVAASYSQAVKSGNLALAFEYALNNPHNDNISRAIKFAEACKRANFKLTVRNYSYERNRLLTHLSDWLCQPESTFVLPPVRVVNRSLDSAELEIQRAMNKYLPVDGAFLAQTMSARLPPAANSKPKASREALETYSEEIGERIKKGNAYFGRELYYEEDIEPYVEGPQDKQICLSREQLDVMMETMAARLRMLSRSS